MQHAPFYLKLSQDDSWNMDRPHFHESVEFLLPLSHGGQMFVENQVYDLTPGTMFEGAELVVETLPLTARCLNCAAEYQAEALPAACPDCGGEQAEVLAGTEAYLENIEFSVV